MEKRDLERIVFHTNQGIVITDDNAVIVHVNEEFTKITGYSEEEVIGQTPRILQSGRHDQHFYESMWRLLLQKGYWRGRIWNRRKNGELYREWLHISRVQEEQEAKTYFVAYFIDIHEINVELDDWMTIAYHDTLTGAYNRSYLKTFYASWHSLVSAAPLIMLLIDLDAFKSINDNYGHETGDLVLITIVQRIQALLRTNDILVRLGGDEFLLIVEQDTLESEDTPICQKIHTSLTAPIHTKEGAIISVGASIGIAWAKEPQDTFESIYQQVDNAMYRAKRSGGGCIVAS